MSDEKAKYRVLRLSHIHNNLWPEGSEVEYDGEPGSALEPLNEAAKEAKALAEKRKIKTDNHSISGEVFIKSETIQDSGEIQQPESGAFSNDLNLLRQQYEELFNEKPGNRTAETLSNAIAEKRKELGI